MTTTKTISIFLDDAEQQIVSSLNAQELSDNILELTVLPLIRDQVETILRNQIGIDFTETSPSIL